jgi:hypothetical protein
MSRALTALLTTSQFVLIINVTTCPNAATGDVRDIETEMRIMQGHG